VPADGSFVQELTQTTLNDSFTSPPICCFTATVFDGVVMKMT
jgi:hypothetical protein